MNDAPGPHGGCSRTGRTVIGPGELPESHRRMISDAINSCNMLRTWLHSLSNGTAVSRIELEGVKNMSDLIRGNTHVVAGFISETVLPQPGREYVEGGMS